MKLLVIAPGPLGPESRHIVNHAIAHVESYAGRWRSVDIETATGRVSDMAREAHADHVLLLGTRLAGVLPRPPSVALDAQHMLGILRESGARRWIGSPHPELYTVRDDEHARKSRVVAGNCIGHLVRDLELLRWGHAGWDDPAAPVRTRVVRDIDDVRALERMLTDARELAIDTETADLRRIDNQLLMVQLGCDGHTGWVLPVHHAESTLDARVLRYARGMLRSFFENGPAVTTVFANATFDLHQLTDWLHLRWYEHRVYDVQYGAFGLDENRNHRRVLGFSEDGDLWGLERLCQEHGMFHYATSPVRKDERSRMASIPLRRMAPYGALDAALPLRLMHMQLEVARRRDRGMPAHPYRRFRANAELIEGVKTLQITAYERNGLLVDRAYTASLGHPDSPFQREVRAAEAEWRTLPEVVEANRRVISGSGAGRGSLWNQGERFAFDVGKPDHRQMLFFEVCGLTATKFGKNGKGSIDKAFKRQHRHVPIVKALEDREEAQKLYGTYIVGYHDEMRKSRDMRDGRLRCYYDGRADTSRLKSARPNLQNVPNRKGRAKLIKRQFVASRGRLLRKRDFSAHEVRMLGISTGDPRLAERFWAGMQTRLRHQYAWTIEPERAAWWEQQLLGADIHRQNYGMMHGIDPITVTKQQRDSVKVPMFASTYGKSMPVLGLEICEEQMNKLEDRRVRALALASSSAAHLPRDVQQDVRKLVDSGKDEQWARTELRAIEQEMQRLQETDWTRYAENLYDQIFRQKFPVSGDWLARVPREAARTTLAPNMLGGVRHLYGYLHPERQVQRGCDRRGPNSAIQGPASNLGLVAAYLLRRTVWRWFVRHGAPIDNLQCNAVHDSTESETAIHQVPLLNYLETHAFSTLTHRYVRDRLGHAFNVGLESDAEVGATMAVMHGTARWNQEVEAIRASVQWGNENLGWELPVDPYVRAAETNARIVHELRRAEIRAQLRDEEPVNYRMMMSERNALDLGLVLRVREPRRTVHAVGSMRAPSAPAHAPSPRVDWRAELGARG